ncbi:stage II sporulation protein M [Hoyosella sp. G463]|uniref:Stage II sporulation protein M n=1 Tax=Lolliginicoccus lacisalsi TaxID=2742202 RepID=A0A927PL19_9ACTN|nr:stage II sporulation protein M [Lolliginicoccus lacisalsi]MBD8504937.1 stage II sporulation protein M [Lolliginicoccus lacisalsi]
MDSETLAASHREQWARLAELARRAGRLSGDEADELISLYQQATTHLSIARTTLHDPRLVDELTMLVARSRAAITGTPAPGWHSLAQFATTTFPAALYRTRAWWIATALAFLATTAVIATWVARVPDVRAAIAAPDEIRELTRPGGDFESYYSTHPAASFAAQVWTNNAYIAAASLIVGILILPVVYILFINAANVAVAAGLMAAADRLDVFFGLILPHGLLELTAVFVAAGAGMRLGWTVIDPGPRARSRALAEEGRVVAVLALGLAVVLLLSGLIEAIVTPSGLGTPARIGIGIAAEVAFLAYALWRGRHAVAGGSIGDLPGLAGHNRAPVSAPA